MQDMYGLYEPLGSAQCLDRGIAKFLHSRGILMQTHFYDLFVRTFQTQLSAVSASIAW